MTYVQPMSPAGEQPAGAMPEIHYEPQPEPEALAPCTMSARIWEAWLDMEASTRRLLSERPSEGRILFYLILSDLVFFLSWTIKAVLAPTAAAAEKMPIDMGGYLLVAFLMRTAAMYVLAAVAFAFCRVAGGKGSWRDSRAAVFWATLVSAPFGLLAALIAVGMSRGAAFWPALADPVYAMPPYYIGLVPFLWFIAAGLAAAHGMARVGWIFFALSAGTVALSVLGVYLSA